MAIQQARVTRAVCDACPTIVYAEEGTLPKGLRGTVQLVDATGAETSARWFACQLQHAGAAVKKTLAAAKKGTQVEIDYDHPVAAIDGTNGSVTSEMGIHDWEARQDADPEAAQG